MGALAQDEFDYLLKKKKKKRMSERLRARDVKDVDNVFCFSSSNAKRLSLGGRSDELNPNTVVSLHRFHLQLQAMDY